jgi:hypothetical protein
MDLLGGDFQALEATCCVRRRHVGGQPLGVQRQGYARAVPWRGAPCCKAGGLGGDGL